MICFKLRMTFLIGRKKEKYYIFRFILVLQFLNFFKRLQKSFFENIENPQRYRRTKIHKRITRPINKFFFLNAVIVKRKWVTIFWHTVQDAVSAPHFKTGLTVLLNWKNKTLLYLYNAPGFCLPKIS